MAFIWQTLYTITGLELWTGLLDSSFFEIPFIGIKMQLAFPFQIKCKEECVLVPVE